VKYSETSWGRVFVLRLEHGDRLPDVLEKFAGDHCIGAALVCFLGGADQGSTIVVGPEDGAAPKPRPVLHNLTGVSEALGLGTLFLNAGGQPKLHLHAAFGRGGETVAGCTREGVGIWHIGEVVLCEILNPGMLRKVEAGTGFELLEKEGDPQSRKD
jgi:uncharacterized protein